ncbi:MAG: hypothetical protein M3Z57_02995 [Candidatus Dormibacteraeota bacterium]|nr:hypothetical protein [Candidatus Dormibacteraeota bacterium]
MTGLLKVAVAGFSASLVMGALSSGALAHEQDNGKSPSTTCQQSGNQLIQNVSFATNQGTSSSLSGKVASPDHVVASFTVPANCSVEVSLVSYQAPSSSFDSKTASQQTVFDSKDVTFSAGGHSLAVNVPACYFQVDFVRGAVIQHLGPDGSNNFYSAQGRLISASNGGSKSCSSGGTGGTHDTACASSNPQVSNVSYLLGGTTTVTDLRGHATSGEVVKATFTVPANCSMQLSLASYKAPLPYFTRQSAPQQVLFDSATGTFTGGVHSLSVTTPTCMYQVDFVHGAVLTTLGSTPGTDYEDRLISADNGGTTSCTAPTSTPTPTPTATPTPTTPTPTPTSTPTATPHTTVTTPTPSAPTGGVQSVKTTATPGAVLAISASTPGTGANLAIGTAAILVLIGLAFLGLSRIRREEI